MTITTFTYDFDKNGDFADLVGMDIRVLDLGGKPWFIAKDVAVLLGYTNPTKAVRDHCKQPKTKKELTKRNDSFSLHPATKMIPESDLYRLVMRSNMPEAERFQDWVCEDVLPTIRQTGGTYMTPAHVEQALSDPDFIIQMAIQIKEERAKTTAANERAAEAERTKAWIGDKKVASAMGTASAAKREAKRLREKYEDPEFMTTTAIPWLKEVFTSVGTKHVQLLIGQHLRMISDLHDLPHQKIPGTKYPITQWHRDAIKILKTRALNKDLRPKLSVYLKG